MNTKQRLSRPGFTLIEVLVTVTVMIILTFMLFAVFLGVREKGRRTICQSNLKQLAVAMQLYVQDSDERYATEGRHYPMDNMWVSETLPYVKNRSIYTCPTQSRSSQAPLGADYGYNWRYLDQISKTTAATTWMHADAPDDALRYGREVSSCDRNGVWSTWHSNGANYSFADGHIKWFTPEAIAKLDCSNPLLSAPTP